MEKKANLFSLCFLSLLLCEFCCFLCCFLLFLGGLCTLLQLIFARFVRFRLERFVIPRRVSATVPQKFSSLTLGPLRTWLLVDKLSRLIDLISPSDEAGSVTGLHPAFRTPRLFTDPREKPVDTSTLFSFVLYTLKILLDSSFLLKKNYDFCHSCKYGRSCEDGVPRRFHLV